MDMKEAIKQVNAALLAGEPANISVDDFGGYTGYKPQYIIDAMNDVLGLGAWGFEELSNELTAAQGDKGLAIAQVRVWLKGVEFQPSGWGQARVTKGDIGDARKGAQTDAIKKALSYFSIGNRAYQGLVPNPKKDASAQGQQARRPAQASGQATNGQRTQGQQPQRSAPVVAVPMQATTPAPVAAVRVPPLLEQAQAICFDVYGPDTFEQVANRLYKRTEGLSTAQLEHMIKTLKDVQAKKPATTGK